MDDRILGMRLDINGFKHEASERGHEYWVIDAVYKSREGSYYEVGKENSSSVFVNVDLNKFRHVR